METGPQNNNLEFEERAKELYLETLNDLKDWKFEITPAESVFLRQSVRDVLKNNDEIKAGDIKSGKGMFSLTEGSFEVIRQFFWHYYGINIDDYESSDKSLSIEDRIKQREDLYRYIQEKIRKDTELI